MMQETFRSGRLTCAGHQKQTGDIAGPFCARLTSADPVRIGLTTRLTRH
jgi:hypothetical protein